MVRETRNSKKADTGSDVIEKEVKKPKSSPQKRKAESTKNAKDAKTKSPKKSKADDVEQPQETSIYEFTANDISGKEVSLDKYKGHVCIIVNVASKCGHTTVHYNQLVEIYDKYSESKGLRVLAFPCNQFGSQEPGDSAKIKEFTDKKNVKFDVFEKVAVNGKNAHPLWKFLTAKIAGSKGHPVDWNFTKFIIDAEGVPVERHAAAVKPLTLVKSLEKLW